MTVSTLNFIAVFAGMATVWAILWHFEWLMDHALAAHFRRVWCFFKRAWQMAKRNPQPELRHQLLLAPFQLKRDE
jgi:hypothetical protein